jgi:hypothetical protein
MIIYDRITARRPYRKAEAQMWKEMFYEKSPALQKEFSAHFDAMRKLGDDDDETQGDGVPESASNPNSSPTTTSNDPATSSTVTAGKSKQASAAALRSLARGDKTGKLNIFNDWVATRWKELEDADARKEVIEAVDTEHEKAMALWNTRKNWTGSALDYARWVLQLHNSK